MKAYGPKAHLASAVINWGDFYTQAVRDALAGKVHVDNQWKGVADKWVDLVDVNPAVPADVKALVESKKPSWSKAVKYSGPLKDQSGAEKVAKDQTMDDKALGGMSWLVEGVEGSL